MSTIIRYADLRPWFGCADTAVWFRRHGLNWRDFLRQGIDIDALRVPGDHLGKLDMIEAAARAREARNG